MVRRHPVYTRTDTPFPYPTLFRSYVRVAACEHSPDHRLLAYAIDRNGSERYRIDVKDLASGTLLPDSIEETKGSLVWANDGRTLFYVTLDEEHRPSKVFRHRLGDASAGDALVYEARSEERRVGKEWGRTCRLRR